MFGSHSSPIWTIAYSKTQLDFTYFWNDSMPGVWKDGYKTNITSTILLIEYKKNANIVRIETRPTYESLISKMQSKLGAYNEENGARYLCWVANEKGSADYSIVDSCAGRC